MKNYLRSFTLLTLALSSSLTALADNVVYGLLGTPDPEYYMDSYSTSSFDLSGISASAEITVTGKYALPAISPNGFYCGTTVGNKYYAFVKVEDDDDNSSTNLVTVNFTNGNYTTVASTSYSSDGYQGMAYDKANNVVYVAELVNNGGDKPVTRIYTLDPATGVLTKKVDLSQYYTAIASDGNGGLYAATENKVDNFSNYPALYKVSLSGEETLLVNNNSSVNVGTFGKTSLIASEDGKTVYLVQDRNVASYDLNTKKVDLKGSLSKRMYGLTDVEGTEDGKPASEPDKPVVKKTARFQVQEYGYGDLMGYVPADLLTTVRRNFYNTKGQLVAYSDLGYDSSAQDCVPRTFNAADFDANGNVSRLSKYQMGLNDFGDNMWQKQKTYEGYAYNEDGTLAADTISDRVKEYTYNEDGTLAKVTEYAGKSKTFIQEISYLDYDNNGNPQRYVSDGAYDAYKYEGEYEYDEAGNKIADIRYTVSVDPDMPTEKTYVPQQIERWTYTDGVLSLYTLSTYDAEGNEVPSRKTKYDLVDGNPDVVQVTDSVSWGSEWKKGDNPVRYFYADYTDMAESTAMTLTAEQDKELVNTVDLTFTVPSLGNLKQCKFVIFRDALPIDTVDANPNPETGECKYQDKNVFNGTHYYFIQPIFADQVSEGEGGGILLSAGESTDSEWKGYYVTDPVSVTIESNLPAVTDFRLSGGKVEAGDFLDPTKTYTAEFSWTNPEDAELEKYGFKDNEIFVPGFRVADIEVEGKAETATKSPLYEDTEFYVVTKYNVGYAFSDTINVKLADIETITGVKNAVAADGVKVSFDGTTLSLGEPANVAVFTTSGQKVYAVRNASSVNLASLPAAAYVVSVEKNGKVSAYKYSVK